MTTAWRAALHRIWTIARREVTSLIDQPTGYVLAIVFVSVNAFLFFRQAYLTGVGSLRPMLDTLPWLYLFLVPAVSMRTLAEDARTGVLEVVLTQPINELELLLGKFAGVMLFLCGMLACALPIPLGLALGTDLPWGPIVAQFAGAAFLGCALTGIGVWASSVARSQITAFILAVFVMFGFILVGLNPLLVGLPPTAAALAARLGVLSHFEAMGRGVIDLRDTIYFISLGGVFLLFAYGTLAARRLARGRSMRGRLRTVVALATATVLAVNLLGGYIGGRLDLTPGKAYTLSAATKQLVRDLDDIVTIKVFASDALPTVAALTRRELEDMLRDLRAASRGTVRVVNRNPSDDEAVRRDAQALGVQPIQFNVVGSRELQVKEGYLGLAVQYGASSAAIPFVNQTSDLEYTLASTIRSLTRKKKPVLDLVVGSRRAANVSAFRQELSKTYEVRDVGLGDTTEPKEDVAALLLVGDPDSLSTVTVERYLAYLRRGGGALMFVNGADVSEEMPYAVPREVRWNRLLREFGVTVNSDVVYDLAANDVVPQRANGPFQVLVRYPFFVRAQSTGKATVNKNLANALLPWGSSVDTTRQRGWMRTPLFVTSAASGASSGETLIDPARNDYSRANLAQRLVGLQITPGDDSATARGRVILMGNAEFATDNVARRSPENLAFALNAADWVAQDPSLIAIRARDAKPPVIAFESAALRNAVKYANVAGIPMLIAAAGFLRLLRRRRRTRDPYRAPVAPVADLNAPITV